MNRARLVGLSALIDFAFCAAPAAEIAERLTPKEVKATADIEAGPELPASPG